MEELHKWQESFGSLEASESARVAELAKVKVKSAETETRLLSLVRSPLFSIYILSLVLYLVLY